MQSGVHTIRNFPLVASILFYRRFLSRRKGYKCAYGVVTGRTTCSTYGLKVFRKFPVLMAYRLMCRQFRRCDKASSLLYQKGSCGVPGTSDGCAPGCCKEPSGYGSIRRKDDDPSMKDWD